MPKQQRFVRPFVTDLTSESVVEGLQVLLRADGDSTARDKILANFGKKRPNFYRPFETDKFRETLDRLSDNASCGDYRVDALWTNTARRVPYRLLIDTVYALAKTRDVLTEIRDRKPIPSEATIHREIAWAAVNSFASLLNQSCVTAYYWDRRLNRVSFLDSSGLRFPEMMYGISWRDDFPRKILFGDDEGLLAPWYPKVIEVEHPPHGFQQRELVKTCWAISLRWDRSRLAVFVNWRKEQRPTHASSSVEPRDIAIAVQYLNGWFARAAIDLAQDIDVATYPPNQILADVSRALLFKERDARLNELEHVVQSVLLMKAKRHTSVHWITSHATDSGSVERHLQYKQGKYDGFPFPPCLSLALQPDCLVGKGVSVLAAALKVPILIDNMKRIIPNSDPPRSWTDLSIPRSGRRTVSELAVPVKYGGGVQAVINIEHHKDVLTHEHVHRVELVSHLFSRLCDFRERANSNDRGDLEFVDGLLAEADRPPDGTELLSRFCFWAREQTHADLAYLLVYDHIARVFRPRGVSASDPFVQRYLREEYDYDLKEKAVRGVAEDAIMHRLFPRRRGRSWKVFQTSKRAPVPDVHDKAIEPPSAFTKKFFVTILGLPFVSEANALPEGVLWIRWMKQPSALVEDETYLESAVPQAITPALEVVSTMYAVYRYCGCEDERDDDRTAQG